jgi:DNA polymerase (family 10)
MRTRNEPVGLPPFDRIRSVEELCRAVRSGRLRGFGEKSERKLVAALAKPQAEKRFKLSEAEAETEALLSHLRGSASDGQVIVAGSYRRRRDTVGDLDVLMIARDGNAAGD